MQASEVSLKFVEEQERIPFGFAESRLSTHYPRIGRPSGPGSLSDCLFCQGFFGCVRCDPTGRKGFMGKLTQGYHFALLSVHPGLFSRLPSGKKAGSLGLRSGQAFDSVRFAAFAL